MMHKSLKLALAGLLVASSASAMSEWRTPWISERGPLRYTFEKFNKEGSNLELWWVGHYKEADKAFIKHSTKNHPLTELIFNKSSFTMKEIFPNCQVPFGTEDYSPFIKLSNFVPRVNYSEYGFTFGGKWSYPVYEHKGRIGLRASVPFRRIEMERTDYIDKNLDPIRDYVASSIVAVTRNNPAFDIDKAGQAVYNNANGAVGGTPAQVAAAAINTVNGESKAANVAPLVAAVTDKAAADLAAAYIAGGECIVASNNELGAKVAGLAAEPTPLPTANLVVVAGQTKGAAGTAVAHAVAGDAVASTYIAPATGFSYMVDPTAAQIVATAIPMGNGSTAGAPTSPEVVAQFNNDTMKTAINTVANRGNAGSNREDVVCSAYRFDLVQSLEDSEYRSPIRLNLAGKMAAFGKNIQYQDGQRNRATIALTRGANRGEIVEFGYPGWMTGPTSTQYPIVDVDHIEKMPTDLTGVVDDMHVGYFSDSANYNTMFDANTDQFTSADLEDQAAQLWMTFRRTSDSTDTTGKFAPNASGSPEAKMVADSIEARLKAYKENPFRFLERHNYELETCIRRGLGDVDLDLFYEHTFNSEWMVEAWTGVRLPTGQGKDKYGNPYRPMLGNGEHFEVKLGFQAAYQPYTWMNAKLDTYYSFVIEATEQRMAAFTGAHIKNMGPRADAKVDWGYFVGRLDFNFFHPKTSDLRSTFGYEFYYKTEDHVNYKNGTALPWYGDYRDGRPGAATLDSNLARKHTEAMSHKIRFESSYQVTKYLEIFSAMSTVFAGQNVMQDRDCNVGFNVRF